MTLQLHCHYWPARKGFLAFEVRFAINGREMNPSLNPSLKSIHANECTVGGDGLWFQRSMAKAETG